MNTIWEATIGRFITLKFTKEQIESMYRTLKVQLAIEIAKKDPNIDISKMDESAREEFIKLHLNSNAIANRAVDYINEGMNDRQKIEIIEKLIKDIFLSDFFKGQLLKQFR